MDFDGSNQTQITSNSVDDRFPSWSNDGNKIYYSKWDGSRFQIHRMDADGTNDYALTNGGTVNKLEPVLSPDGSKITIRGVNTYHDIYQMDADGSNITQLTNDTTLESKPSYSPDGSYIVWTKFLGDAEIMRMDADGSNITQITDNSDADFDPSYSPDGTKIVFGSDRDAVTGYAVYTMDPDGTNAELVIDPDVGNVSDFDWQPLTLSPTPPVSTPVLVVEENGSGSINPTTLFVDPYANGIDPSSITVTSGPSKGSTTVSSDGTITYTQAVTASTNIFSSLANLLIPRASAQATFDSFTIQVCSLSDSSLCSSSTVNVILSASSSSLANTGINAQLIGSISFGMIVGGAIAIFKKRTVA